MKRVLAGLMIAMFILFSVGCQKVDDNVLASTGDGAQTLPPDDDQDASEQESEEEPTEVAATPEPTPEAAPLAPKDYTYETWQDPALGLTFKYPAHWLAGEPKAKRVQFEAPAAEGEYAANITITMKDPGKVIITEEVGMDTLSNFSKELKKNYTNYKMKRGKRLRVAKHTAFCFTYTGENRNGVKIKGYAMLVYVPPKKNKFYLMHFSCLSEQFDSFKKVRNTIIKSIRV